MASEFRMEREVTFAETDMAGILHFSNYFRYMEEVEHAFFRSLGFSVHARTEEGAWGWARRAASCTYDAPLRYQDVVELHLTVAEKRTRSITYSIAFLLDGARVATGQVTAVCIARPDGPQGPLKAVPMPDDVAAAVQVAPK